MNQAPNFITAGSQLDLLLLESFSNEHKKYIPDTFVV